MKTAEIRIYFSISHTEVFIPNLLDKEKPLHLCYGPIQVLIGRPTLILYNRMCNKLKVSVFSTKFIFTSEILILSTIVPINTL